MNIYGVTMTVINSVKRIQKKSLKAYLKSVSFCKQRLQNEGVYVISITDVATHGDIFFCEKKYSELVQSNMKFLASIVNRKKNV